MLSDRFCTHRSVLGALVMAVATASLAGASHAQINLGNVDTERFERGETIDRGRVTPHSLHAAGVEALQAGDYATAGANFTELVKRQPRNADANFLLGLAKFGAQDWEAAATYLEVAVERDAKRPEPKTRLGLAYIQLGRLDDAGAALAELDKLDKRCRGRCSDDPWIKEGLQLLGPALDAAQANAQ